MMGWGKGVSPSTLEIPSNLRREICKYLCVMYVVWKMYRSGSAAAG
jgi:hypothetical protein